MRHARDALVVAHETIDRVGDDVAAQGVGIIAVIDKRSGDIGFVIESAFGFDDVHADAHHDVGDALRLGVEACLAQDAAHLASVDEDVVHPLDLRMSVRAFVDCGGEATRRVARDERDIAKREARP